MKTKSSYNTTEGWKAIEMLFDGFGWNAFDFQKECWSQFLAGNHGLLNAPTGSGKTYALFLPLLMAHINRYPKDFQDKKPNKIKMIWISPLRSLAQDIRLSMEKAIDALSIPFTIITKTGDSTQQEKNFLRTHLPEVLITTPESLHLLLSQKKHQRFFTDLECIIVDEWHELIGSKRGVQMELAISRILDYNADTKVWGISATIGNLNKAAEVLLKPTDKPYHIVKAENLDKKIICKSIIPQEMDKFPWAGHLGLKLLPETIEILKKAGSSLVFINTRAQTEHWYRAALMYWPEIAGSIALHHGSLDKELRLWVEDALRKGYLKVVMCTSSLDLGVDFTPVDTVFQVGSPKGVARFLQRAGRSGHSPGAESVIWFIPTHALELIEAVALRKCVEQKIIEDRKPIENPIDVLVQYLVSLAVGDGLEPESTYEQVIKTYAYRNLTRQEFDWCLQLIYKGGDTLSEYDEYHKVELIEGLYKVTRRKIAMQHRLSIGTIVGDVVVTIKLQRGSYIGSIEESFVSKLNPGDVFWFGGRALELLYVKDLTAVVKNSNANKGNIPAFVGGRMQMSSQLSKVFLETLDNLSAEDLSEELKSLSPIFEIQKEWSIIPNSRNFLIEHTETNEGYHYYFYTFAGWNTHEGLGSLIAWRIAESVPISFSIAKSDYGFELLTDVELDLDYHIKRGLFSKENLKEHIGMSLNATEMAKRKFRDIAQISGLIYQGMPGKPKKNRHLQSSTGLLFEVFEKYDPSNLLFQQAFDEIYNQQLEKDRIYEVLERIENMNIVIKHTPKPTPFAFPILIDRLRETLSTEKFEDKVRKLQESFEAEFQR